MIQVYVGKLFSTLLIKLLTCVNEWYIVSNITINTWGKKVNDVCKFTPVQV